MKRLLFFIALYVFSIAGITSSQEKMNWDAKFAFGGGFTPGWFVPNFDGINDRIEGLGIDKFSTSGFFATGGTGYVSLPMLKNFRVGGMGLGGSTSKKATVGGFNREAEYSIGMGGLTVEYTLPFIPSVAVSVGTVIGWGSVTLELYQNSGAVNWNDIWGAFTPNVNAQNIHQEISSSFFLLSPILNVDIPVDRFIAFRVGGGYQVAVGGKWKLDNGQEINNVPDSFKKNNFFIQTGIFIGYFNY